MLWRVPSGHLLASTLLLMAAGFFVYAPQALVGIAAANLLARLVHDKKTVQGKVHFVLPVRIGEVKVISGIDEKLVLEAIRTTLT